MHQAISSSLRLAKLPHLQIILSEQIGEGNTHTLWRPFLHNIRDKSIPATFIGWGRKKSGISAVARAASENANFILLEDGFLRSLGSSHQTPTPLSIICDSVGIYYDSRQPSKLEQLLQDDSLYSDELAIRAKKAMAFLHKHRLSKYNNSPEKTAKELGIAESNNILLIDQTYGDASIAGANADAADFKKMLHAALDDNPNSKIIIKTHPDVVAGKKLGYLTNEFKKLNDKQAARCILISDNVNPWSLIDCADIIYTVSSQLGFEALFAGKKVHCFGMPFYAGWGVTTDKQQCPRRTKTRTIEEIFAAAYLFYPKYINPFTSQICKFEELANILALWRSINENNRTPTICLHMSRWKRAAVSRFLQHLDSKLIYANSEDSSLALAKRHNARIVGWSSRISAEFEDKCKQSKTQLIHMEDGFIRSVGLGANLTLPSSLTLDTKGIYYDATRSSDLEHLLNNYQFDNELLQRADKLIQNIIAANISKYNLQYRSLSHNATTAKSGQKIILVTGQVEDDASIAKGSPDIKRNIDLLRTIRENNQDKYIIYKPHPDTIAGQRKGAIAQEESLKYANHIEQNSSIVNLIEECDEVHTMTSLAGFEALIRGKTTHCYGIPFYAGWGLTTDYLAKSHQDIFSRRQRKLRVTELAAATLILYPRYLDPQTGLHCTPEILIERLQQSQKTANNNEQLPKNKLQQYRVITIIRTIFGKARYLLGK